MLLCQNDRHRNPVSLIQYPEVVLVVGYIMLGTLAAFGLGVLINRVTGKAIFNPLLLGSIFVIILLSAVFEKLFLALLDKAVAAVLGEEGAEK